jgi:hypothetical protein
VNYEDLRPSHVRVLGRNYALLFDHDDPDECGKCEVPDHEINIRDGMPPVEEADTVLHEIMHAVWEHMDIGHRRVEESVVRKLATGLTQVFQDNPALVQYLVDAGIHQPS